MQSTNRTIEPVHLVEDGDTGDRLIVYMGKDGVRVDLRVDGGTFWATQAQMGMMFGVTKQDISKHLKKIFKEGELNEDSVVNQQLTTAADGKRYRTNFYDLNALIAVGYRIEAKLGTLFRIWATDKLFQYLTKGFVIDDERLKEPDDRPDFFDELLERIRDIRSSEARMWTRVLELASFCSDYDRDDKEQHVEFFAEVQNTMHWAVSERTAAMIVRDEVHADKDYAGVIHFAGKEPTAKEAANAKNLLGEMPIKALNHITSLTLEFFESQAEQRRPTTLPQFLDKMRDLVRLDGRPVKRAGYAGTISRPAANQWAADQIREWKAQQRVIKEERGAKGLIQITTAVKARKVPQRAVRKSKGS